MLGLTIKCDILQVVYFALKVSTVLLLCIVFLIITLLLVIFRIVWYVIKGHVKFFTSYSSTLCDKTCQNHEQWNSFVFRDHLVTILSINEAGLYVKSIQRKDESLVNEIWHSVNDFSCIELVRCSESTRRWMSDLFINHTCISHVVFVNRHSFAPQLFGCQNKLLGWTSIAL